MARPVTVLLSLALVANACGGDDTGEPPASTSLPTTTANAVVDPAGFDLLTLGFSQAWGLGDALKPEIESELGVTVSIHDRSVGGQAGEQLRQSLQTDEQLQVLVREAEMVTINIAGAPGGFCMGRPEEPEAFGSVSPTEFEADYGAMLDALLEVTNPDTALLRVFTFYFADPLGYWERDEVTDKCLTALAEYNDSIRRAAEERGITVLDLGAAFHGPDYDRDLLATGYLGSDNEHTSPAGVQVLVDLVMQAGFDLPEY